MPLRKSHREPEPRRSHLSASSCRSPRTNSSCLSLSPNRFEWGYQATRLSADLISRLWKVGASHTKSNRDVGRKRGREIQWRDGGGEIDKKRRRSSNIEQGKAEGRMEIEVEIDGETTALPSALSLKRQPRAQPHLLSPHRQHTQACVSYLHLSAASMPVQLPRPEPQTGRWLACAVAPCLWNTPSVQSRRCETAGTG